MELNLSVPKCTLDFQCIVGKLKLDTMPYKYLKAKTMKIFAKVLKILIITNNWADYRGDSYF